MSENLLPKEKNCRNFLDTCLFSQVKKAGATVKFISDFQLCLFPSFKICKIKLQVKVKLQKLFKGLVKHSWNFKGLMKVLFHFKGYKPFLRRSNCPMNCGKKEIHSCTTGFPRSRFALVFVSFTAAFWKREGQSTGLSANENKSIPVGCVQTFQLRDQL